MKQELLKVKVLWKNTAQCSNNITAQLQRESFLCTVSNEPSMS